MVPPQEKIRVGNVLDARDKARERGVHPDLLSAAQQELDKLLHTHHTMIGRTVGRVEPHQPISHDEPEYEAALTALYKRLQYAPSVSVKLSA